MVVTRTPGALRVALIDLGTMSKHLFLVALAAAVACLLSGCGGTEILPAMRPLPKETVELLAKKGMTAEAPIYIRIFKEESELEVWKQRADGHFYHFKTYPICNWSGELGPKERQGDKQAPEGFYTITQSQMNPNSSYHLAFNLGFPNNYDKAHKRTGEFLMVHGKCKSAGCYAMTDALIEEIYGLAREQFIAGNESFQVHAFPFRMTDANLARYRKHKWYPFWRTLKEGYDYFEMTRQLPQIAVCERRYLVNVKFLDNGASRLDPEGQCPAFERPRPMPFTPMGNQQVAETRLMAPGVKMRQVASTETGSTAAGGGYMSPGVLAKPAQPTALGYAPAGN